jgi:hypothetical protein
MKILRIIFSITVVFWMIQADSHTVDKNKFKNVLLIINFNHPYYKNIDFLKKLYAPYFNRIVFYGTQPHQEVTCFATNEGRLISEVLYDALARNPGYDGYLFLEDDCILNMWNCFELDINKMWFVIMNVPVSRQQEYKICPENFAWANLDTGACHADWAWVQSYGLAAVKKTHEQLLPKDLEHLRNNIGKDYAIGNTADMFYFPTQYRDDVMRLCAVFKDVYIEIAIPTMFACLDDKKQWELASIIWGISDYELQTKWPIEYTCVHPVKLSSATNRELTKNIFAQMLNHHC